MDVNEILMRVVPGHRKLLVLCLVLPALAVGVLVGLTPQWYVATARLQGGTSLPGSDTEADALLNLVRGRRGEPRRGEPRARRGGDSG
ncbi:MAG: hypothetical protein ACXWDL_07730 [Nocardioides sp.]